MDINQLRYAVKIIELKSFTRAAEQLFITQPTLSQQINKLENDLGVKLFNRTTRSFSLTEAGKLFYDMAKNIIISVNNLESSMSKFQTIAKTKLKIGILPTLSKIGLTNKIAHFLQENKGLEIDFVEDFSENLLHMIINKKIDVALINRIAYANKKEEKLLNYLGLFEDRVVLIINKSHRLSNKTSVNIMAIKDEPLVMLTEKSSISKIMKAEFARHNIKSNTIYECASANTLIDLVDEGMGISFLSERIAKKFITDRTAIIKLTPKITNKTAIVTLKDFKDTPLLKKFYHELTK